MAAKVWQRINSYYKLAAYIEDSPQSVHGVLHWMPRAVTLQTSVANNSISLTAMSRKLVRTICVHRHSVHHN